MNDALNWAEAACAAAIVLVWVFARHELITRGLVGSHGGADQLLMQVCTAVLVGRGTMSGLERAGARGVGESLGVVMAVTAVLVLREWAPVLSLIPGA